MGEFTACVSSTPDDSRLRFVVVHFLRANPALRRENAADEDVCYPHGGDRLFDGISPERPVPAT